MIGPEGLDRFLGVLPEEAAEALRAAGECVVTETLPPPRTRLQVRFAPQPRTVRLFRTEDGSIRLQAAHLPIPTSEVEHVLADLSERTR